MSLTAPLGLSASAGDPAVLEEGFIFESGPCAEVHATTIAETYTGMVAAWFGGTKEGKPDVGIWFSSRGADGRWTEAVQVADGVQSDGTRLPAWNPVLFQPRRGPLMLFYKVGPDVPTWWGEVKRSADGGETWSAARRLPAGFYGPIKNKPLQRSDGGILCPSSDEANGWSVHFELCDETGVEWKKIGPVNDGAAIQAIQPSLLDCGGGQLMAIGRTRQDRMFEIRSEDGGLSWGALMLGDLPNNNSGTDAVTLKDGRHLVVYNHATGTPGEWGGSRTPLNLAVSPDAKHWNAALVLENEPGEYSYPAIIQAADGRVHITYTWKRRRLKHVVLDPNKLNLRSIDGRRWPALE